MGIIIKLIEYLTLFFEPIFAYFINNEFKYIRKKYKQNKAEI